MISVNGEPTTGFIISLPERKDQEIKSSTGISIIIGLIKRFGGNIKCLFIVIQFTSQTMGMVIA
jgi:hypothetical protein